MKKYKSEMTCVLLLLAALLLVIVCNHFWPYHDYAHCINT